MSEKGQNKARSVILDSISEGVFTVDMDWRITSFNRAAEEITGIQRKKAIGRHCGDVLRADVCETNCTLAATIQTGRPIMNKVVYIIDAQGKKRAVVISTALLKDTSGKVIGGVETFRDMSTIEQLRKQIQGRYSCEDIISQSHKMQDLFAILPNIAESNTTILIEGESGTGKELFAKAIHNLSFRKDKPFVAVNCGADLPPKNMSLLVYDFNTADRVNIGDIIQHVVFLGPVKHCLHNTYVQIYSMCRIVGTFEFSLIVL